MRVFALSLPYESIVLFAFKVMVDRVEFPMPIAFVIRIVMGTAAVRRFPRAGCTYCIWRMSVSN